MQVCLQKMPADAAWVEQCMKYAGVHGFEKLCYLDEDGFVQEVAV